MKIIAVINNKGGVGKTTVTMGLARALAKKHKKILVIDTDPQGNISRLFGFEPKEAREKCLYNCLNVFLSKNSANVEDYIEHTKEKNIDILTGDMRLTQNRMQVEQAFMQFNLVYRNLITYIKEHSKYDFVFFDTCPSLGGENTQIMMAAEYLIIPSTTARNSVEGIDQIVTFFNGCTTLNPNLKLLGIVINNVTKRSMIAKDVVPMLKENYKDNMFDTVIESSAVVSKAEWIGNNRFKENKVELEMNELAKEVLKKIGK